MIPPVPRSVWIACSIVFTFGFTVMTLAIGLDDAVFAVAAGLMGAVVFTLLAGLVRIVFLGVLSLVEHLSSQGRHTR